MMMDDVERKKQKYKFNLEEISKNQPKLTN